MEEIKKYTRRERRKIIFLIISLAKEEWREFIGAVILRQLWLQHVENSLCAERGTHRSDGGHKVSFWQIVTTLFHTRAYTHSIPRHSESPQPSQIPVLQCTPHLPIYPRSYLCYLLSPCCSPLPSENPNSQSRRLRLLIHCHVSRDTVPGTVSCAEQALSECLVNGWKSDYLPFCSSSLLP